MKTSSVQKNVYFPSLGTTGDTNPETLRRITVHKPSIITTILIIVQILIFFTLYKFVSV